MHDIGRNVTPAMQDFFVFLLFVYLFTWEWREGRVTVLIPQNLKIRYYGVCTHPSKPGNILKIFLQYFLNINDNIFEIFCKYF